MRRIAAVAVVAAVALAGGCSSGGSETEPNDRLSLEPTTTTTTTPEAQALAARIPDDVLPGFTPADDVIGTGPLDLADAAAASAEPDAERRRLERYGFVRGTSRSWLDERGDHLYVAVYEFVEDGGAEGYDADQRAELAEVGTPFDVPGGTGVTTTEQDGDTTLVTHAALVRAGARWALVLVASDDGRRPVSDAVTVATEVLARL